MQILLQRQLLQSLLCFWVNAQAYNWLARTKRWAAVQGKINAALSLSAYIHVRREEKGTHICYTRPVCLLAYNSPRRANFTLAQSAAHNHNTLKHVWIKYYICLLYTSDAADE